jgi:para-nitrobenzyl esterase
MVKKTAAELKDDVIWTSSGPVTGMTVDGVRGYLGIPYAAPPVGNMRWRPPVPPEPWKEPCSMTEYGPICPQSEIGLSPIAGEMNEDCLSLNIWTPAEDQSDSLPVMVLLHGGGFSRGCGSDPICNETHLARKGVVLITINYRLGAFGFLAHPALTAESPNHSSGNYGIMDQIMALRWIQKNIRLFGGNPDNVTVFGHSAGGASIIVLMASPVAEGLFHRAIAQSCGYAPTLLRHLTEKQHGLDGMESLGLRFTETLGIAGNSNPLEVMRSKPWSEIIQPWEKAVQNRQSGTGIYGAWILNHVILDGYILQQPPGTVFRHGKQQNIPLMIGTAADEGSIFPLLMNIPTVEKYHFYLEKCFGELSQRVMELYPADDDASVSRAFSKLRGDCFPCGARALARNMSVIQPKTFLYQFTLQPKMFMFPLPGMEDREQDFGCYHGAELPYLFQFFPGDKFKDEDLAFSAIIMGYWTRFARNGDPNGESAPLWPAYEPSDERHLNLDFCIKNGQHLMRAVCENYDGLDVTR